MHLILHQLAQPRAGLSVRGASQGAMCVGPVLRRAAICMDYPPLFSLLLMLLLLLLLLGWFGVGKGHEGERLLSGQLKVKVKPNVTVKYSFFLLLRAYSITNSFQWLCSMYDLH